MINARVVLRQPRLYAAFAIVALLLVDRLAASLFAMESLLPGATHGEEHEQGAHHH